MSRSLRVLAILALLGFATTASAAPIVFTLDSALSTFSLSIGAGEPPSVSPISSPQSPGSDITSLFGEIFADISGGNISLLPGGVIGLADQPVDQSPDINGEAGSAPAQLGLNLTLPPLATGPAAIRETTAEATTSAPAAIVAGTFDGTLVNLGLLTSVADIRLTGIVTLADRADLGGNSGPNESPVALLTNVGDSYTMTIPLLINIVIPAGDDLPIPLTATITGNIVATGVLVPEPGTIAMLGMGLIGLVAVGRRRFRKA